MTGEAANASSCMRNKWDTLDGTSAIAPHMTLEEINAKWGEYFVFGFVRCGVGCHSRGVPELVGPHLATEARALLGM
jgi:hypothetical protein